MDKVFLLKDASENVVGKFKLTIDKVSGLEYRHISGVDPCWQDIVGLVSSVVSRNRIPSKGEYFFQDKYTVVPNNTFDIMYAPILKSADERIMIPVYIDNDRVQVDSFKLPFETVIKVLLALSMSYGEKTLVVDKSKAKKMLFTHKYRKEYVNFAVKA